MTENTITARVHQALTNCLAVEYGTLTDTAKLADDLAADSLDIVEVIMELEQEFDIEIPDDDFPADMTVGGVVDLITRLTQPN